MFSLLHVAITLSLFHMTVGQDVNYCVCVIITNKHVDVIDDHLQHFPYGFLYGVCEKRLAV